MRLTTSPGTEGTGEGKGQRKQKSVSPWQRLEGNFWPGQGTGSESRAK